MKVITDDGITHDVADYKRLLAYVKETSYRCVFVDFFTDTAYLHKHYFQAYQQRKALLEGGREEEWLLDIKYVVPVYLCGADNWQCKTRGGSIVKVSTETNFFGQRSYVVRTESGNRYYVCINGRMFNSAQSIHDIVEIVKEKKMPPVSRCVLDAWNASALPDDLATYHALKQQFMEAGRISPEFYAEALKELELLAEKKRVYYVA